jgi:hypothetical protein
LNFSDDFFINGSNGYVGIGTPTPSVSLEVVGNINLNNTLTIFNSTGGAPATFTSADRLYYTGKPFDFDAVQVFSTNLRAKDSSGLGLYDDDSNLGVFINDSGNVGIGTSTPEESLHIMDGIKQEIVSSPEEEGYVSSGIAMQYPLDVFVSGDYAYVTGISSNSLAIVDISNPNSPEVINYINSTSYLGGAYSVFVSGDYAYVTSSNKDALAVVDVSNPFNLEIVGFVNDSVLMDLPRKVTVSGKYAYVLAGDSDSLAIVDISNPTSPEIVGSVNDSVLLDRPWDLAVKGEYAYISVYGLGTNGTFTIVNISDPLSPEIVTNLTAVKYPREIFVSGKYAYITSHDFNFTVIDISNPTSPEVVGSVNDPIAMNVSEGLFVSGKYAYVTSFNSSSVSVIDISNPTSPEVVGFVNDTSVMNSPFGIYVSGKYAYVTGTLTSSLTILDIHGTELTSVDIGNLKTGFLDVLDVSYFGKGIHVSDGIFGDNLLIEKDATIGRVLDVDSINDRVGIGTTAPTEKLDIDSDTIRIRNSKTPASSSDTCDQGEIAWNNSYVFVCVGTDTWKRANLSSW